jgi:uncharacterized repeat protein (TIGR03803 family)
VAKGDGCRVAYVVVLICASAIVSPAQTFTTRLNFNGSNGASPNNIVQASDGNLWGTTYGSGDTSCGTVFKMTPAGSLTTVFTFDCNKNNDPDGEEPGELLQGHDGNFYGVTFFGGPNDEGSVFKLTPDGSMTLLAAFDGSNGTSPVGIMQGTDGNFYGTTYGGGNQYGYGTIFKMTPTGGLTTLYQFDFTHGAQPYAGLIQATDGNF